MAVLPDDRFQKTGIAIAGGGMVGLSLALLIAARQPDWRITVIEAFAPSSEGGSAGYRPSFDARSTALSDSSRQILTQLELWEELSMHVAPISQVHVSDRGHVGSTRLSAAEQQLPSLGAVVENQWLGAVLQSAVSRLPNIEVVAPARIDSVKAVPGGMQFSLVDVSTCYHADLLIVADGAQSATREKLGIGSREKDYGRMALIANVSLAQSHEGVAYERFTDQGPMALLPLPDLQDASTGQREHRSALVWTLPPEQALELQACDADSFLQQLQERFGYRVGAFRRVGERFCYPLKLIESTEQVRSNMVVMGNAAHSLHPVAGQGFNLSLRDAAMLADVLSMAGRRGQSPGELAVLQQYLDYQQQDQQQTVAMSDWLPTLFGIQAAPVALARNVGLLALDAVPPLRRQFSRLGMGLETRGSRLAEGNTIV
jgi:2-polyprenyl-6-methoxyphenol 4-hydroxylase